MKTLISLLTRGHEKNKSFFLFLVEDQCFIAGNLLEMTPHPRQEKPAWHGSRWVQLIMGRCREPNTAELGVEGQAFLKAVCMSLRVCA